MIRNINLITQRNGADFSSSVVRYINFSDEQLSNIGSFYKATMDSELNAHINKNYPDLLKQPKNNKQSIEKGLENETS